MPTYEFRNKKTGKTFEEFMSMSQREEYLKDNPHIESIILTAPAISGDSVGLGFRKNDAGFNELMNRIGKANPGSAVADRYVSKNSREVAVDKVAKKHGLRKNK